MGAVAGASGETAIAGVADTASPPKLGIDSIERAIVLSPLISRTGRADSALGLRQTISG